MRKEESLTQLSDTSVVWQFTFILANKPSPQARKSDGERRTLVAHQQEMLAKLKIGVNVRQDGGVRFVGVEESLGNKQAGFAARCGCGLGERKLAPLPTSA